jgi:hypothetical protein
MTIQVWHTHTHTHTHTRTYPAYIQYMWKVTPNSWNPGITLLCRHFHEFKDIKLRKHRNTESGIIPTNVLRKKTYYFFYADEDETLIHQSLCLKQSLELKSFLTSQWCTWTHVLWYLDIHWTYSMYAECFLLGQFVMVDVGNRGVELILQLVTSRKHCWLALFGTDTNTGNI